MNGDVDDGAPVPDRELVEGALRYVPLLETYYRRAHTEMPDELRHLFQDHHLTARHGAVLAQLAHDQRPSVGELSTRLGVGLSTVSEMVGDLDRVGLVVRHRDPDNGRRVLVALSDEHKDTMRAFMAGRAGPLVRVFERLTPSQREGFAAGLRAWAEEIHRD
ncbi:DNA-binding MarR family transcriptional regulator [Nocardiopsis sp. Huas11]|uniref:MarR family winged helix-turn-helix transcriptional regulator n=1 Tax=Nocardiopsis sp. Huas11 TaxID=2183912 RepID=UPI000EAB6DA3|nr:MarR family transcriptional regulator [Nocardiopsis sp. Huas11]RKS08810.1 DNA-binding MarR family transcriptional regulator [Nocardiopsis sp. Huas11]